MQAEFIFDAHSLLEAQHCRFSHGWHQGITWLGLRRRSRPAGRGAVSRGAVSRGAVSRADSGPVANGRVAPCWLAAGRTAPRGGIAAPPECLVINTWRIPRNLHPLP